LSIKDFNFDFLDDSPLIEPELSSPFGFPGADIFVIKGQLGGKPAGESETVSDVSLSIEELPSNSMICE
jgi:hypothetical protein